MKANRKIVQLSLISIGLFLIIATYIFYPTIKENKLLKENIVKDKTFKIDDDVTNVFENVIYKGENSGNPFTIHADKAEIKQDPNVIYMKTMLITIFLKDSKWVVECAAGIYNKLNYNIFCSRNVKATDGKVTVYSQNLDLLTDESATIYNNVLIIDENKSSLYADRVNYDFEKKLYHISMFDNDNNVKVKLVE